MRFTSCILVLVGMSLSGDLFSQNSSPTYSIKNPGSKVAAKCGYYFNTYSRFPIDARYGTQVKDGTIYFFMPGEAYFNLIFDKRTDGIAFDIVRREQYQCYEKNQFTRSWASKGYLMEPMYKAEMMKNAYLTNEGFVVIVYRDIPEGFDLQNIECNLVILQKKFLCDYRNSSHVDYSNWGLLEMGLYKDSLSASQLSDIHKEVSKSLHFTIPFQRNEYVFDRGEIQPLYDSLHLTDYNIVEISIKAYTSVAGSLERNLELQMRRAQSIVDALQSFQTPEIISSISANENWVNFINDIQGTPYSYLADLTKEEIKQALSSNELLDRIEPILKLHRKALVELRLQKKFTVQENDPVLLKKIFDQSIADRDIEEALYLQSVIMEKVKDHQLPQDFIGKLEIPSESMYGPLLNNYAIFRYEQNDLFLDENIQNFEQLLKLLPNNVKVLYNITVLKTKAITNSSSLSEIEELNKLINRLEKLGLEKSLVRRLKVNYHIVLTQYHNLKNDFVNKDKSIKEVYWLYSRLDLSDTDLLSLAKYLAIYSKFEWAEAILLKRVKEVDADEDLLFYFLSITINNPKNTSQSNYRTYLLNAIDKNGERFCSIFLPKPQGGSTFQLLEDEFLRKTYCENCISR